MGRTICCLCRVATACASVRGGRIQLGFDYIVAATVSADATATAPLLQQQAPPKLLLQDSPAPTAVANGVQAAGATDDGVKMEVDGTAEQ